jgi:autotransporter adhesin
MGSKKGDAIVLPQGSRQWTTMPGVAEEGWVGAGTGVVLSEDSDLKGGRGGKKAWFAVGQTAYQRAGMATLYGPAGIQLQGETRITGIATLQGGANLANKKIVALANGTAPTDSVNVSQLTPTIQALGGGATLDARNGVVTGPRYNLTNGGTQTTVGGALTQLDTALSKLKRGEAGLVQENAVDANLTVGATTGGKVVDFTGKNGARRVTGVSNGAVSAASQDAVNGAQLHGASDSVAKAIGGGSVVNPDGSISQPIFPVGSTKVSSVGEAIANIDGRVTQNNGKITELAGKLESHNAGMARQESAGANVKVGATTDGAAVDFTGKNGARQLTGVANGTVSAASLDAVNGAQLHGASDSVAKAIGGGSAVNPDGSISQPTFNVGSTTVSNVGDAITNVDGRVTKNTGKIAELAGQLGSGNVGMVRQDSTGATLKVGAATDGVAVDFTGKAGPRVLTGLANGVGDGDAVTVAQMRATVAVDLNNRLQTALKYDDATLASATLGGTHGTFLNNVAPGAIAADSMQAVNGAQLYVFQANLDGLTNRVTSIEAHAGSGPSYGGSVLSQGTGRDSVAVGSGSGALGDRSTAIGNGAIASGDDSSAIGYGAIASGNHSTTVGQGAKASGENSTAMGSNSNAIGNSSVALGADSVATRDNSVSVGSVGNERQITNVAAGAAPTDAVNVQQLNDQIGRVRSDFDRHRRDTNAGTASAVALGMLPQAPAAGKSVVGVAAANYAGQSAVAIGLSTYTANGKWILKAGGSTNTRSTVAVGGSVGYIW